MRTISAVVLAAASALLFACSLLIPFGDYDKGDKAAPDAGLEGGDAGDPDAADAQDADTCDADFQMTSEHCGVCGHSCLSRKCTAGVCEAEPVFVADSFVPLAVAIDPLYLYVGGAISNGPFHGAVARILKSNPGVGQALAATGAQVVRMVAGETDLFWTQGIGSDAGPADRGIGRIAKVPVDAGLVAVPYVGDQPSPYTIALDDVGVYWSNYLIGGNVWSASRRSPPNAREIVPASVPDENIASVAVDGTDIYWTTFLSVGRILSAKKDGTSRRTVAMNQNFPAAIAVDDQYVYWTNYSSDGSVMRVEKAGGIPQEIAKGQRRASVLVADGGYVYWVNEAPDGSAFGGSVNRAPKSGGKTLILALGMAPTDLAVDDRHVYWPSNTIVFRVPK